MDAGKRLAQVLAGFPFEQTPANFGPPIETDAGQVPLYRAWQTPNARREGVEAFRAQRGEGMMVGPEWLGLDVPLAEVISPMGSRLAESLVGPSGVGQFLPGLGDLIDARDAIDYAGQAVGAGFSGDWGRLGTAGSLAAIAAMGALPGIDAPPAKATDEALTGIRAYHGSPHDFPAERLVKMPDGSEQFIVGRPDVLPDVPAGATVLRDFPNGRMRMDKIGTGEGAQAYGHGLYAAGNENVAIDYRDALAVPSRSSPEMQTAKYWLDAAGGDRDRAIQMIKDYTNYDADGVWKASPEMRASVDYTIKLIETPPGRMYELNIAANPDDFLDWDKPLAEQPAILARLREMVGDNPEVQEILPTVTGEELHRNILPMIGIGRGTAAGYQHDVAADALRGMGAPGIKYLDAGSRAAGEGSRNYVVFDDSLISILRKYGIAGLLAAPALAAMGGKDDGGGL